jgi:electron-transferring-flavoprotein dehydrogenase
LERIRCRLNTEVTQDQFLFLTKDNSYQVPNWILPHCFQNEGNYIVSLANVTRWLGEQAEALGVEIFQAFQLQKFYITSKVLLQV